MRERRECLGGGSVWFELRMSELGWAANNNNNAILAYGHSAPFSKSLQYSTRQADACERII